MLSGMGRGHFYTVAVSALLVAAGVVAWRTWSRTSAGQFDPVSAVIALAGVAISVAALGLARVAQRQADTDVNAVAGRLAVAVGKAETEARRQLLGGYDRAIEVQFTFHPAPAHEADGAGSKGTLKEVVAYYRKLRPRRMVITGAAGSGKTVLAIELILGLLETRAADAQVPVRMSAASLDTSRPVESAVEEWLAEHLRQTYGLSEAAALQLVAARMVLPVLDGLDEMDAIETPGYSSRAGQAIRACNAYLDAGQKGAMVLTCRITQYDALEQDREWLRDAARIQLSPVGMAAARSFLTRRVTDERRWQEVLNHTRRSSGQPLGQALSTPWRLTIAATVYDQRDPATGNYIRDPADLTAPELDTEDKIRDHLLGLFIPAAIAAYPGRYAISSVHRWLAALSGYLDSNTTTPGRPPRIVAGRTLSGSDLVLHELWPIAGSRAARAVNVAVVAAISVGLGVAMLTHVQIGFTRAKLLGAASASCLAVLAIYCASVPWPQVKVIDLHRLKTREGGIVLAAALAGGIALGLVGGFLRWFSLGLVGSLAVWLSSALVAGVYGGLAADPAEYSVADPRRILRSIFLVGSVVGPVVGLAVGLVLGHVVGPVFGVAVGLAFALATGPLGFLWHGLPGLRYIALLLCTRRWSDHWLPWRLAGFLDWCYQAGLIRVAGISYQLRHRELQDYLARNPTLPAARRDPTERQPAGT